MTQPPPNAALSLAAFPGAELVDVDGRPSPRRLPRPSSSRQQRLLVLDRDLPGTGPDRRWARWRVLDGAEALVGFVSEDRPWLGHTYGPSEYYVAHNPSGKPFAASWRAEGFPSPGEALGALADHLAGPTSATRRNST